MGPQAGRGLRRSGHAAVGANRRQRRRRGGGAPASYRSSRAATTSTSPAQGASPEGDRPFLDRLNVKTLEDRAALPHRRPNRSRSFVAPLERRDDAVPDALRDAEGRAELLHARRRRRTPSAPSPRSRIRSRSCATSCGSTSPTSARTASRSRARSISRPATSRGRSVPVIMWAYPREFGDADSASQVTGSPNSFTIDPRRLAHVPAALGLRDLRQPDDADHRPGRDGERHLRRAAGRERAGGDRQGRRDGRRRSRSHRRRRPQLRRRS